MSHIVSEKLEQMTCLLSWMSGKATSAKKLYFQEEKNLLFTNWVQGPYQEIQGPDAKNQG